MGWNPPLKRNSIREAWGRSVAATALDALGRISRRNPVDTGYSRANWIVTVGNPTDAIVDATSPNLNPSLDRRALENFASVFIQNNVPYIIPLEYGHSTRFPSGMVRITVAELEARV
jgi:hypothetical protein